MTARALCLIREAPVYRKHAFVNGLRMAGFEVVDKMQGKPTPDDLLVTWNRYGNSEEWAQHFERVNAPVIVVENGYLGNGWLGDRWFAVALNQHNGAGTWHFGGDERWDALGVELAPWRTEGTERVVLAQRGIGSSEVCSPDQWAQRARARVGGRIRPHPGKDTAVTPLEDDLQKAACVITWGSTAALKALMMGIPVWYDFPKWIGGVAARPLKEFGTLPNLTMSPAKRSDTDRLYMFRHLIWAMWRAREIEDGTAFRHLLRSAK